MTRFGADKSSEDMFYGAWLAKNSVRHILGSLHPYSSSPPSRGREQSPEIKSQFKKPNYSFTVRNYYTNKEQNK